MTTKEKIKIIEEIDEDGDFKYTYFCRRCGQKTVVYFLAKLSAEQQKTLIAACSQCSNGLVYCPIADRYTLCEYCRMCQ